MFKKIGSFLERNFRLLSCLFIFMVMFCCGAIAYKNSGATSKTIVAWIPPQGEFVTNTSQTSGHIEGFSGYQQVISLADYQKRFGKDNYSYVSIDTCSCGKKTLQYQTTDKSGLYTAKTEVDVDLSNLEIVRGVLSTNTIELKVTRSWVEIIVVAALLKGFGWSMGLVFGILILFLIGFLLISVAQCVIEAYKDKRKTRKNPA